MSYHDINIAICNALGLDPDEIAEITVTFTAGNPPEVKITRHLLDECDGLVIAIERCELRPKADQ